MLFRHADTNMHRLFCGVGTIRGHPDDRFHLVPSALRNESKELSELVVLSITNNKDQQWAENRVLADFLDFSDSIGLHIPRRYSKASPFV